VRADRPQAFAPGGVVSQLLRADPDRYIPAAVRERTPLPTETDSEQAARRGRYRRLRSRLRTDRGWPVNDLVTLNLDLPTLAQDLATNRRLQPAFVQALKVSTILDPTCGSGA